MNNSKRFWFENAGKKKHQDIMDRNKTIKNEMLIQSKRFWDVDLKFKLLFQVST